MSLPPPAPPVPPPPAPPAFLSCKAQVSLKDENSRKMLVFIPENTEEMSRRDFTKRLSIIITKKENSIYISMFKDVPAMIQDGPQCGIIALAMAHKLLGLPAGDVCDIMTKAIQHGYSLQGEMFSVFSMAKLAEEVYRCETDILDMKITSSRQQLITYLLKGFPVLVPYDADFNHEPCKKKGHKAHWTLLTGVLIELERQKTSDKSSKLMTTFQQKANQEKLLQSSLIEEMLFRAKYQKFPSRNEDITSPLADVTVPLVDIGGQDSTEGTLPSLDIRIQNNASEVVKAILSSNDQTQGSTKTAPSVNIKILDVSDKRESTGNTELRNQTPGKIVSNASEVKTLDSTNVRTSKVSTDRTAPSIDIQTSNTIAETTEKDDNVSPVTDTSVGSVLPAESLKDGEESMSVFSETESGYKIQRGNFENPEIEDKYTSPVSDLDAISSFKSISVSEESSSSLAMTDPSQNLEVKAPQCLLNIDQSFGLQNNDKVSPLADIGIHTCYHGDDSLSLPYKESKTSPSVDTTVNHENILMKSKRLANDNLYNISKDEVLPSENMNFSSKDAADSAPSIKQTADAMNDGDSRNFTNGNLNWLTQDKEFKNLFHINPDLCCTKDINLHLDKVSTVYVYGQQGKSANTGVWSLDVLLESNSNLREIEPVRTQDSDSYIFPSYGITEELCGKIVVLKKITSA